jgi:hypothetical protein
MMKEEGNQGSVHIEFCLFYIPENILENIFKTLKGIAVTKAQINLNNLVLLNFEYS